MTGNYERWESDQTRVGPEYLQKIAEAFGIDGDLWLLAYAWLVDGTRWSTSDLTDCWPPSRSS